MSAGVPSIALFVLLGCGGGGGGGGSGKQTSRPSDEAARSAAPRRATACTPVPWQDEYTVGEATYRGTIVESEAEQPNGTIEKALVLNLDAPVCLPPSLENEDKQTDSIHIYSTDDTLHGQLAAQRNKKTIVTVTGAGFLSHTAHHHRPIVVDVKRVTVK